VGSTEVSICIGRRRKNFALIIGLLVFLAVVARDLVLRNTFAFGFSQDTNSYIHVTAAPDKYSKLLPLLYTVFDTQQNPYPAILFQQLVGALATGTLVAVVARKNKVVALLLGFLFVLDLNWAYWNLMLLSEGLFMSFHVLALTCLSVQFTRLRSIANWELFFAGLLYGIAFFIRPSGIYLLLPVIVLYGWRTRSIKKTISLIIGSAVVMVILAVTNLVVNNTFSLQTSVGENLAYPLYNEHLFSPENGPASKELYQALLDCTADMDTDYRRASNQYDLYFAGHLLGNCYLFKWNYKTATDLHTQAYVEAALHRPVLFMRNAISQHDLMLSLPLTLVNPVDFSNFPIDNCKYYVFQWCRVVVEKANSLSPFKTDLSRLLNVIANTLTGRFQQLYLLPYMPQQIWTNPVDPTVMPPVTVAWLVVVVFLILVYRGTLQILVLASAFFIEYAVSAVVLGHVYIPRYAQALSPFHDVLSVLALYALASLLIRAIRSSRVGKNPFSSSPLIRRAVAILIVLLTILSFVVQDANKLLLEAAIPPAPTVDAVVRNAERLAIKAAPALRDIIPLAHQVLQLVSSAQTVAWLESRVHDHSRIFFERAAADVVWAAKTMPVGSSLDWKELGSSVDKPLRSLLYAEGHYLLIDERTVMREATYDVRLRKALDQGGTLVYESPVPPGSRARQAVVWTFHPQHFFNVTFDSSLKLVGVDTKQSEDGSLDILFYWYTARHTPIPYQVFIHILDPKTDEIVAQADTTVGGLTHPTSQWNQNEIVFETIRVPAEKLRAVKHPYTLQLGLYQADTGARAAFNDVGGTKVGDSILFSTSEAN
jgi:hypothetical protein